MPPKLVLLFYIGNGLLKATLVRLNAKNPAKVLIFETDEIAEITGISKEELESKILINFDRFCQKIQKAILESGLPDKKLDSIFINVSSPWYLSSTKTFKMRADTPFLIKSDTIGAFLEKAGKNESDKYPEEMLLLEQKIISVSLNGYPTKEPLRKMANSMGVSVVQSLGSKKFLTEIDNTVSKYFLSPNIHMHTLSLGSFVALRDIFKDIGDFVLVNVTSLVSEVSLVKENVLYETVSIPFGFNHLLITISKELKVTTKVASSLLKLYQHKEVEDKIREKITKAVANFKVKWTESLTEAFNHLSGGVSIPSHCYLISQNQVENIFADLVQAEDYSQFSFSQEKFKVEIISGLNFVDFINFNKNPLDSTAAIAAIFAKQTLFN